MRKVIIISLLISIVFQPIAYSRPFQGSQIVMTAANTTAVQSAQAVAEAGGNVVDVAIALVLNMSVTNATFAALGGGGFAMIKMGKAIEIIDFRERAPQATHPDYFKNKGNEASITGGAAVGVPGMPAGLWEMHKKYGKIHWSKLFDQAIRLADKGYRVSGEYSEQLKTNSKRFSVGAKKHFLKTGQTPFEPGEIFVQKNLGRVLKEMRNRNIVPFYKGDVAKDIVNSVKAAGGDMTLKDLADYKVAWRKPIETQFAGHKIHLMPPPSSGGIVIKTALHLIEKLNLSNEPAHSTNELHLLTEILSRSFRGRTLIADPDHHSVPMSFLTSDKYWSELEKSINRDKATGIEPLNEQALPSETNETTHLSVMDKFGNAVSMTITLNGNFGSGVASEKYGIMLNNEMDDFTTRPGEPNMFGLVQGAGNMVAPGKRPLSSMSPTLVEKDGKIVLALGAPGGPRIISSVVQVLYRALARGTDLQTAIEAPRVHHQLLPNKLYIDKNRLGHEVSTGLTQRGHVVEESWQGRIYATRNANGILEAVVDTRGEGAAGGF